MKKNLLIAVAILLSTFSATILKAQNATPAYTGYTGTVRDQAVAGSEILYVNTNASDGFLFKGSSCGGPKIPITWNNFDQTGSQAQCVFGFVKQKNPLWVFSYFLV